MLSLRHLEHSWSFITLSGLSSFGGPLHKDPVPLTHSPVLLAVFYFLLSLFFKSIGHQSTKVLSLDEMRLDDQYTMVKAHFLMRFKKASGEIAEAKVDSTYFLFMKGDSPKIIMHMEHEDVKEAMQARGLL
jgi:hypothetical protein